MVITINCSQIVHSFCFELKSMLLLFFIYLFRIHLSDRCRLSRKKICLMHDREIFRSTSNIKYNSLGIFNCSIRALVGLDTCTCRHHSRPNKQYPIVWLDFENKKAKDRIESDLNIADRMQPLHNITKIWKKATKEEHLTPPLKGNNSHTSSLLTSLHLYCVCSNNNNSNKSGWLVGCTACLMMMIHIC